MKLLTVEEIRTKRIEMNISQARLANLVGVHKQSMYRFEKGTITSLKIQYNATNILNNLNPGQSPSDKVTK